MVYNSRLKQSGNAEILNINPRSERLSSVRGSNSSRISSTTISSSQLRAQERHLNELERDNYHDNVKIEIPSALLKSKFARSVGKSNRKSSGVKKILSSKKTLANWIHDDEHDYLMSLNQEDEYSSDTSNSSDEEKSFNKNSTSIQPKEDILRAYRAAASSKSMYPGRQLCSICGYISKSSCVKCGARICGLSCNNIHSETRCIKFYL